MRQLTMETYIKHQRARYAATKRRKDKLIILNEFFIQRACQKTCYSRFKA